MRQRDLPLPAEGHSVFVPEVVVGVDPGMDSGVSAVTVSHRPELLGHACMRGVERGPTDGVTRAKLILEMTGGRPSILVVEDMPPFRFKSAGAVSGFEASVTRWKDTALAVRGMARSVERANVSTWRRTTGVDTLARSLPRKVGTVRDTMGLKIPAPLVDYKRAARLWVQTRYGITILNDNTCEAIAIATHLAMLIATGEWHAGTVGRSR